jgi:hypothetical protein
MSLLRAALEIGHAAKMAQTYEPPTVKIEFRERSDYERFRVTVESDPELSRFQDARDMLNARYLIGGIMFELVLKDA